MSQHDTSTRELSGKTLGDFREVLRETFSPHTKSEQYFDHPESPPTRQEPRRHNDGAAIHHAFGMEALPQFLTRAAEIDHPVARHPKALAHFVTHVKEWEKWEPGSDNPTFDDLPKPRRELFEWYLGHDKPEGKQRKKTRDRRMAQLRPGGTGMILHGEEGKGKTTGMYWLISMIMYVNQQENIIWTLDTDEQTIESHLDGLEACELVQTYPDGRVRITITGEELLALDTDDLVIVNST